MGFAFKANTNDTRESAAISICKDLIEEGAILNIHDPKVESHQIEKDLNILSKDNLTNAENKFDNREGIWSFKENIFEAIKGSDAVLIPTEWEEYSEINWEKASTIMRRPSWVFDTRSIIEYEKVKQAGINLWRVEMD